MTRIEQFVSYFHNESINLNWEDCLFPNFLHFAPFFSNSPKTFHVLSLMTKKSSESYTSKPASDDDVWKIKVINWQYNKIDRQIDT